MASIEQLLQQQILRSLGITRVYGTDQVVGVSRQRGRRSSKPQVTDRMRYLEELYDRPIEELLTRNKKGRTIAIELGITESAVCKWRRILGV